MNTDNGRLWKHIAGCLAGILMLGMACNITVMAGRAVQTGASGAMDVYESADTSSRILVSLYPDQVQLLEEQGDWVRVQAGGITGWAKLTAAENQAKVAEEQLEAVMVQQTALAMQRGISLQELEVLAALIQCEAGGESYVGQVAVGNVVMNRMESEQHPDTVMEVIYEEGQFTPVGNGMLSRTLNSGSVSPSCRQAALEAAAGSAPVGDLLYFRRVNGRSGQIIGNHVFY